LQTAWGRLFSTRPMLLLLLGSDLHMMARLTAYDRPFYGRADNLVLGPLDPAETGAALHLDDADARDAHLVSSGLPGILRAWPDATPALAFLEGECADPSSPVFGVPGAALLAELPQPDRSRRVLEAIGPGQRTHADIAADAGSREGALPSGVLSPLLRRLTEEKGILHVAQPLSTRAGKPALYRVADSNLRFYLAALRRAEDQVRRGHSAAAFRIIERVWSSWRGGAVEPLVRETLELAAAAGGLPWDTQVVGGWWNRRFDPEIDLIGADRGRVASRLHFTGSVKWLGTPFDRHDLAAHAAAAAQVPGFEPGRTGTVVVSLSGTTRAISAESVDVSWGPADVVAAWR
jgi:hypothetical protein